MPTTLSGPGGYVAGNPWTVLANVWNPSGLVYGTDYTQTVTFDPNNPNLGFSATWSFDPTHANSPGSYSQPNLEFGPSPGSSAANSYHSGLPLQLSAISSLFVDWGAQWTGDTNGYDVNIDLRLTDSLGNGFNSVVDDIIIWIHRPQGLGAPLGSDVGTYQINGQFYDLWYDPNVAASLANFGIHVTTPPWKGSTFVAHQDLPSGSINLADVFAILKARGVVTGSEYLYDVLIGPEITKGTGSFTANYFNVNVNGQGNYLQPGQTTYFGSTLDDQIYLYGAAKGASPGPQASGAQTFFTTVVVELNGTSINGSTPTVDVEINGVDMGRTTIINKSSGFADSAGVVHTAYQDLIYQLPGLVRVTDLKVTMTSPTSVGGPEDASVFLNFVKVNDVALTNATYTFPQGFTTTHIIGSTSNIDGGSEALDATPWNQALNGYAAGSSSAPLAVNGEGGTDVLHVLGSPKSYTINQTAAGQYTLRESAGLGENANLTGIATVQFQDGETLRLPAASEGLGTFNASVDLATSNVLRQDDPSFESPLASQVNSGQLTLAQAATKIVQAAANTSSVATLAYEFFTGGAPSAAGMDYLVSPTGPNPNNLNALYYQSFSLENRYINFAVNLGKLGAGEVAFNAAYGALNLFDATRKAYTTIFGGTPSDTKLHALLDPTFQLNGVTMSRADYFAYYGQDGANGIGTKAAMVGWLLSEAVKADVGTYALSNDAFLADVALHGAPFAVDIVGHYSQPSFVFNPG